jgi:hypothetical protein
MQYFHFLLCFSILLSCKSLPPDSDPIWNKLGFKLQDLPSHQDYEFCINDTPTLRSKVLQADHSVRFMESPGRIGCKKGQVLCIGNTSEPKYKYRLYQLCRLDFVQRIELTHWE